MKNTKSLGHFMEASSLNSLQYVQNKEFLVRIIWIFVNILLLGLTIFLITTLWNEFIDNPTVTSLENANFPVSEVPFPAVSICDINKISSKKAEELAHFISKNTGVEINTTKDHIRTLGTVYDFDDMYFLKQMRFQRLLETLPNPSEFGLREIMRKVAPSCEDFLISCSWMQHNVNCSEIFQMRLTFEGYCCIFNYVNTSPEEIARPFLNAKVLYGQEGIHDGLTFELNHNIDDYFYTKMTTIGANIHVFNSRAYPDKNSGALADTIVGLSSEVFIQVKPFGLHTVEDTFQHSPDKRQCIFKFERKTFMDSYSKSNCLTHCRQTSMAALCGCVPFMYPQNQTRVCTLSDMQCLAKYKIKWERLQPADIAFGEELQKEAHFGLICEDRCFPVCNGYMYKITRNAGPIKNSTYSNRTLVHVYYNSRYATIYKQDLRYYWFEILSNFGGICGVFLGVSLITAAEILLFCAYKIRNYIYYNVIVGDDFCNCIYDGFK